MSLLWIKILFATILCLFMTQTKADNNDDIESLREGNDKLLIIPKDFHNLYKVLSQRLDFNYADYGNTYDSGELLIYKPERTFDRKFVRGVFVKKLKPSKFNQIPKDVNYKGGSAPKSQSKIKHKTGKGPYKIKTRGKPKDPFKSNNGKKLKKLLKHLKPRLHKRGKKRRRTKRRPKTTKKGSDKSKRKSKTTTNKPPNKTRRPKTTTTEEPTTEAFSISNLTPPPWLLKPEVHVSVGFKIHNQYNIHAVNNTVAPTTTRHPKEDEEEEEEEQEEEEEEEEEYEDESAEKNP